MCMDSTIPRKRLADILLAIAEMETKYGLRCGNVFHAGDGNLHPLILFDANDPDQLHRAELFGAEILETSVAMGGTVTGEHGVGVEKLKSMCVQFAPAEREQMLAVKRAFDPAGLLNPGKVIPTLQRCAEYGKHARQARPAAVSRAAAVLSGRSPDRRCRGLVERVRDAQRRRPRRCCIAAAAPRTSTARRRAATCSTCAALAGIVELRADRAGRHRARRHAAGRTRGAARRAGPVPAVRAAALRRRRRRSAAWSPPGWPGRRARRPAAVRDYVLGATLLNGRGEVLRFGGQVMKNVAGYDVSRAARRLARHARRDPRGVAEGAAAAPAEATLRFDMRAGARRWRRCNDWGGQPLPLEPAPGGTACWCCACAARAAAVDAALHAARRRADRAARPPARSGRACATTRDEFFVAADDAIGTRARRCGACRCRRPRRRSGSPASS